jgi:hypothetical protein
MSSSIAQRSASRSTSGSPEVVACSSLVTSAILSAAIVAVLPIDVEHQLEDHAVALAVKGLDLHQLLGHYSRCRLLGGQTNRTSAAGMRAEAVELFVLRCEIAPSCRKIARDAQGCARRSHHCLANWRPVVDLGNSTNMAVPWREDESR